MDFFQSNHISSFGLWTPLIGGLILYVGLHLKVTEVDPNEE